GGGGRKEREVRTVLGVVSLGRGKQIPRSPGDCRGHCCPGELARRSEGGGLAPHWRSTGKTGGGIMSQYICWNCGLTYGDPSEPWEPSKLCPSCAAAMNRGTNRGRSDDYDSSA